MEGRVEDVCGQEEETTGLPGAPASGIHLASTTFHLSTCQLLVLYLAITLTPKGFLPPVA